MDPLVTPSGTATYTYDANGNRITQGEGGVTTYFYLSNLGQVIEEDGSARIENVWGVSYVNDLVQQTQYLGRGGTPVYYVEHDAN